MKTFILFLALGILFLPACKKTDETVITLSDYFSIEGADLVKKQLPASSDASNAPSISLINGNSNVINGGSNPISIYSNSEYSYVLVGIKDVDGEYYKFPATLKSANKQGMLIINLVFENELPANEFVIRIGLMNSNNIVGDYQEINVNTINTSAGSLQISCSWDLLNDIDIHVVEPDGNEIYYGNPGFDYNWEALLKHILGIEIQNGESIDDIELTDEQWSIIDDLTYEDLKPYILDTIVGGNLDLDSNADCYIDSINNENIIYPEIQEIQSGIYIVRVDFYSDCVEYGDTHYIVTARYNGELIEPISSTNPYYNIFESGWDDNGGEGDGVEIMRFKISNDQFKSAQLEQKYSFSFPVNNKVKQKNLNIWSSRFKKSKNK
jgi:hypothetical protein